MAFNTVLGKNSVMSVNDLLKSLYSNTQTDAILKFAKSFDNIAH